jgi:hypothetical protein
VKYFQFHLAGTIVREIIEGAIALPSGSVGSHANFAHQRNKELNWYEIQGGADNAASSDVAVEGLCHD